MDRRTTIRSIAEGEEFAFYLGYVAGKPAATVATMQTGDTASIEFVST